VRNRAYIFFLSFFLSGLFHPAKGNDTLFSSGEYLKLNPLNCDSATYKKFKEDKSFNYYSATVKKESLSDRLYRWLIRKLCQKIDREDFDRALWIAGIFIFIVMLVVVYLVKPSLFYINKKNKLLYSIEEEDIHGYSFGELIKNALNREQYPEAIRWVYLQTLEALHEKKWISRDASKTVNEYVHEIGHRELRKDFKSLSEAFVYYRYGKGEANGKKFRDFEALSEQIIKQTG
jgi:hypothetical protein